EQNYRVCVAIAETRHALRRDMYVGKVIPLSAGSASRVLLAWDDELAERVLSRELESMTEQTVTEAETMRTLLAQTRADGYAITTGERETGASGLSAPVFDSAADIVGAVTISGPTLRMPQSQCEDWVDLLISHAEQITRTLGGRYPA
ncbi:IclR family transcriptional regulator, partial [Rhodococcus sp. EPR-279]